jgi:hypothetical protein
MSFFVRLLDGEWPLSEVSSFAQNPSFYLGWLYKFVCRLEH